MAYRVFLDGRTLMIEFSGVASREDIMGVVREVGALEKSLGRAPDRIVDCRRVLRTELDFSFAASLTMQRERQPPPNRYRIVFLESTDAGYGVARMFQALAEHADVEVKRVASMEEALAMFPETAEPKPRRRTSQDR